MKEQTKKECDIYVIGRPSLEHLHNGVKSYKTFTVVVIEPICVDKCNFVKVNHFQILLIPFCTIPSIQPRYRCLRIRNT